MRLRVAFDALPLARWGPLFHVLRLEHPTAVLEWKRVAFPTSGSSRLDGADVGLFVHPPQGDGLASLTIERSPMVVLVATGHRLALRSDELRVADVLDEPFPGGADFDPGWKAFWTLDKYRGGPPRFTDDVVHDADEALDVVAAGRAITTSAASMASGLPHPGLVGLGLVDGPVVETRLVWRSDDGNPLVHALAGLAAAMAPADRGKGRS